MFTSTRIQKLVACPEFRRTPTLGLVLCGVLLTFSLLSILFPHVAVGQDFGMPWLDSETGKPKPVEMRSREDASTRDRIQVPNYTPKKSANQNAGGGTLFTMPSNFFDFSWLAPGMIQFLLIVPVVVILILVIWMVMRANFAGRDNQDDDAVGQQRSIAESIKHLPFELDASVEGDFKSHAAQAYRAGNYKRAVICLLSHVLVSMDQNGGLRLKKGKTNRQYLREIRNHQELATYYGQVMVPFEETFFGDHSIEKTTFEECWSGLDQFQLNLDSAKSVDG